MKLSMKHQGMELYKVYINHDPGMTLTYFTATRQLRSPKHLNGEKWENVMGYIHVYDHNIQTILLLYHRSQVSIYRTIGRLVLVS